MSTIQNGGAENMTDKLNDLAGSGFIKHVTRFDSETKSELLNLIQYLLLIIVPVFVLNKTVQNMIDLLEWNGLLIFTCASTGRPEHGTRRTALDSGDKLNTDTVYSEDEDYYRNLTKEDFQAKVPAFTNGTLVGGYWVQNEGSQDLYYRGWKR